MQLSLQTLKEGYGPQPQIGNKVTVHYVAFLQNGQQFDSTVKRGQPFTFNLGKGEVIKGWDEGVAKMKLGQKALLTCPPEYAYGDQSIGKSFISSNSTLLFQIELLQSK